MNDMLARLSQHNRARYEEPRAVALRSLAENVVAIKGQQHPVILSGDAVVQVMADPVRLEQILNHLVQNAIDASTPANPVTMRLGQQGMHVSVEVIDRGCGMSAEFIRSQLFNDRKSVGEGKSGLVRVDIGGRRIIK